MDDRQLIDYALSRLADIPEKSLRMLATHLRIQGRFEEAGRALDTLQERTGETGTLLDSRADLLEHAMRFLEARLMRELRCARYPDAQAWIRLAAHLVDIDSADRMS